MSPRKDEEAALPGPELQSASRSDSGADAEAWATAPLGAEAEEVGYRLHRLGLCEERFEVTPGYRRTEEQLRKAARSKMPGPVAWTSVAEALADEVGSAEDRPWYARRRAAGEGREGVGLVAQIARLGTLGLSWRPLQSNRVAFIASPALRPVPCLARITTGACGGDLPVVAFGPGMAPSLGVLGACALFIEASVRAALPPDLGAETQRLVVLMVAGSVLLAGGVSGVALDTLLEDATAGLVPPQHRANAITKKVRALAERGLLDQPPGEIERTIHGLGRRRSDRLHRAWLRGFFVPRGAAVPGL